MRPILLFLLGVVLCFSSQAQTARNDLQIILIRHGEKPKIGDNLTCQGLNRSLQLPAVLYAKMGIPAYTYIPAISLGDATKHARMFQTIIPFAVKYNLTLTSTFSEKDSTAIANDILGKKGTVLIIWEHKCIPSIARALGVKDDSLGWPDDDYDSLWTISFPNGLAKLTKGKEGLNPSTSCPF